MRLILRLLAIATCGGIGGHVLRQQAQAKKDGSEPGELVIATTVTPILAGVVAGLLVPKKWRTIATLIVSANVAANLKEDPLESFDVEDYL